MMHRIWNLPDLTEKQEEQIDELTASMRKEMRAAHKEAQKLREELHGLVKDGASDAKIEAKIDEAARLHADKMKKHALLMRDVARVLTEEQREALFSEPDGPPRRGKHGKGRW
jgi:Spy/CpxP family protein refolding chaperone